MASPSQAPQRKPVRSTAYDLCMCQHRLSSHPDNGPCQYQDCEDCRCYRPRPCSCGHAISDHKGRDCSSCDCSWPRVDRTAEFLLRMGIRGGEWQFIVKDQLRYLLRPDQEMKIRVWACGMLHSVGSSKSRVAVKRYENGRPVLLTPQDIVVELNAMEPSKLGRIDKHAVRKALRELELEGVARVWGDEKKGSRRLGFYVRPRKAKIESVSYIGVKSDPQTPLSDTNENHLQSALILAVRKSIVKSLRRSVRELLTDGADEDRAEALAGEVERIAEEVVQVVTSGYERIKMGVSCDPQTADMGVSDAQKTADMGVSREGPLNKVFEVVNKVDKEGGNTHTTQHPPSVAVEGDFACVPPSSFYSQTHAPKPDSPPKRPKPPEAQNGKGELVRHYNPHPGWAVFWTRYSTKDDSLPAAAKKWWVANVVSEEMQAEIMDGLDRWMVSDQWARQVVQHAITWLSKERYKEHPKQPKRKTFSNDEQIQRLMDRAQERDAAKGDREGRVK